MKGASPSLLGGGGTHSRRTKEDMDLDVGSAFPHCIFIFLLFWKSLFIGKTVGHSRRRGRLVCSQQAHFLDGCSIQELCVSYLGVGIQPHGQSSTAFLGPLARNCVEAVQPELTLEL